MGLLGYALNNKRTKFRRFIPVGYQGLLGFGVVAGLRLFRITAGSH